MLRHRLLSCLAGVAVLAVVSGCAASGGPEAAPAGPVTTPAGSAPGGPCPVEPIDVVVSVDQWRELVQHLAGRCATVTTIISGSAADPHEFEPSPADVAAFADADLVVVNGLGYDAWASAAAAARRPRPATVSAAEASGAGEGDNPHLWYRPAAVEATSVAVGDALRRALPGAEAHLDERAAAWRDELGPLTGQIAAVRARHGGRRVAATEPVAAPLIDALGLVDATPPGYAASAANGSDPAPGDLAAFNAALRDRKVDVLVVNTQTQGPVPDQLRRTATDAGVPVVEVTETVAPGQPSSVAWQLDQLQRLDRALAAPAPS